MIERCTRMREPEAPTNITLEVY